jgi:hypothetical protein
MAASTRRAAAAMLWLAVAIIAAALAAETSAAEAEQLGCFCDCMKNRCMTLGASADKFDCAAACTGGCTQIGQPGQPRADDFCGF